ncbi:MAG: rod shape-determining protein MreC [Candidatus Solibacter usitatus]|nr:rod shape-determining protein MreC [Candidatus Solibacter usitatus]
MEFILQRYKNLTTLLVILAAQLVLLAYQVKTGQDMRLLRIWAITAVTPFARVVEMVRGGTSGFLKDYLVLLNAREENRKLRTEMDGYKLENQILKAEMAKADRARVLAIFQTATPLKTLAASIVANAAGTNAKVVYVDRGSNSGLRPGMAVITPDGIAGKVISVYPTASQVMLLTDSSFAAGVVSERFRVHGTAKGQGHGTLVVDYVPSELRVEVGEKFYTSGDDRIFPKGLLVGEVKVVRPGRNYKEIFVAPSAFQLGLEEVLIVVGGVHQPLPGEKAEPLPYHLMTTPGARQEVPNAGNTVTAPTTDADRIREKVRKLGETSGVKFGEGGRLPDFSSTTASPPAGQR